MNERRHILRLFAFGNTPDQVAEILSSADGVPAGNDATSKPNEPAVNIDISDIEKLFKEYLVMPIGEKQRQTLLTEQVSDRRHRLMDDIANLDCVDALLAEAEDKETTLPLLNMKCRIKDRMAKEDMSSTKGTGSSEPSLRNLKGLVDECYDRVHNAS